MSEAQPKTQYYIFSDEGGTFEVGKYFLRSCFIIRAEDYNAFSKKFNELKENYSIPTNDEFKYMCLFNLYFSQQRGKPCDKRCQIYADYDLEQLHEFVEESIKLLVKYNIQIITVYTKFKLKIVGNIHKDFMKTMLNRIEPFLDNNNAEGVVFYDDFDKSERDRVYKAYSEVFEESKFLVEYKSLKDSLSFDSSKYSAGIQVVDYIIGLTTSFMLNREWGKKLFENLIHPNMYSFGNPDLSKSSLIPLYLKDYPDEKIKLMEYNYKPPKTFEELEAKV